MNACAEDKERATAFVNAHHVAMQLAPANVIDALAREFAIVCDQATTAAADAEIVFADKLIVLLEQARNALECRACVANTGPCPRHGDIRSLIDNAVLRGAA